MTERTKIGPERLEYQKGKIELGTKIRRPMRETVSLAEGSETVKVKKYSKFKDITYMCSCSKGGGYVWRKIDEADIELLVNQSGKQSRFYYASGISRN